MKKQGEKRVMDRGQAHRTRRVRRVQVNTPGRHDGHLQVRVGGREVLHRGGYSTRHSAEPPFTERRLTVHGGEPCTSQRT